MFLKMRPAIKDTPPSIKAVSILAFVIISYIARNASPIRTQDKMGDTR